MEQTSRTRPGARTDVELSIPRECKTGNAAGIVTEVRVTSTTARDISTRFRVVPRTQPFALALAQNTALPTCDSPDASPARVGRCRRQLEARSGITINSSLSTRYFAISAARLPHSVQLIRNNAKVPLLNVRLYLCSGVALVPFSGCRI